MLVSISNECRESLTVNDLRLELSKRKLDVNGRIEALDLRFAGSKRQKNYLGEPELPLNALPFLLCN